MNPTAVTESDNRSRAVDLDRIELDDVMPDAPFAEKHRRIIDAPLDVVWRECLAVEAREVRALGPLMAIRMLPSVLRGRGRGPSGAARSFLDEFADHGFVMLRRDAEPVDDRAVVVFGAAGRFWSVSENAPVPFESAAAFVDFDEPGYAVTVANLEASALPGGRTLVETETRVVGTDRASTGRFAPYWALIRLPSGGIRRSWLAAIDRRVAR